MVGLELLAEVPQTRKKIRYQPHNAIALQGHHIMRLSFHATDCGCRPDQISPDSNLVCIDSWQRAFLVMSKVSPVVIRVPGTRK